MAVPVKSGPETPHVRGLYFGPMEKEGAVQPQVFPGRTDFVPIVPGERWRFNDREYASRTAQLSNAGCIGWRQLEPLADGAVVDAQLSSDRPSGRDVLVQGMHLGDAQRAPRDAPSIPFRICIMLVRRRRRATQSAEQGRTAGRCGVGSDRRTCLTTSFTAWTTRRVAWNKHN